MKKSLFAAIAITLLFSCGKGRTYEKNANSALSYMKKTSIYSSAITDYCALTWAAAVENHMYKGRYTSDFNRALSWLYADLDSAKILDTLNLYQSKLDSTIKTINEPPEKYKDVYSSIIDCYSQVSELSELAKSPKGSLMTFSQSKNELQSKIAAKLKEVEVMLPSPDEK